MSVTREIKEYLHGQEFCNAVVRRYLRFEILSEAALRTEVANLLIAKIKRLGTQAEGHRVTCEVHLAGINIIPDILIWKKKHPRIWIELKATRCFDTTKAQADWAKLQINCKDFPSIKAGYLIYVSRWNRGTMEIRRTNNTRRYWPIGIALSEKIEKEEFGKWYVEYKRRAHYSLVSSAATSIRTKT